MAVASKKKGKSPPSATTDSLADTLDNWADKPESKAYEGASKLYNLVQQAYDNQQEQADQCEEYWNIYNAVPDSNAQYNGNSQGYIPAVRNAINARAKRALKQLFPANNRHVDVIASDGSSGDTVCSLQEYYIRTTDLKQTVRSDLIAGDVTGQWGLYIDWFSTDRVITKMVKQNPIMEHVEGHVVDDLDVVDEDSEEEVTEQEEITEQGPEICDFAVEDLAVIPPTCNNIQKAQVAAYRLRLSKEAIQQKVDEGVFILPKDTEIDQWLKGTSDTRRNRKDPQKRQTKSAGVKTNGTDKFALIYWVMTKLDFGGEFKEEAYVYFSGQNEIIGIVKNPLWSGKRPFMSQPVERLRGSFFGRSKIEPIKFTQWNLNDFWNLGQDSAFYSLTPIYAIDPLKCPQWQQLMMGLAAMWPVAPDGVKPLVVPQLWKEAAPLCDLMKREIWESFDVNEMMMGKMPQGRKNNQLIGAVSSEQSVTITDHASRYEEVILNPLLEMMFEFDQQFRDSPLMIEQRGEIGIKAQMEEIPVMQWGTKYQFRWQGTDFAIGAQRIQQGIALLNVLKGYPPQMLNGRTIDATPALQEAVNYTFGPEMGPRIFIDHRNQYAVDPELENEILHNKMEVMVHEMDDDEKHLRSHMYAASINGDPLGLYKVHMQMHMEQIMKKRASGNPAQGAPGGPGGMGANGPAPGVAGTPKPGAMPAPGRPAQNPPGAINADRMADPNVMGRG